MSVINCFSLRKRAEFQSTHFYRLTSENNLEEAMTEGLIVRLAYGTQA